MSTPSVALRASMQPLARRVRAYFAPVKRSAEAASLFDPAAQPSFSLDVPPAPWLDLGWIANFKRLAATQYVPVSGGVKAATLGLARKALSARVDFDFCEWGKLQMALAGGSQHMNVLATDNTATAAPSGGYEPLAAVPLIAGSTTSELVMNPANVLQYSVQDLLAVDVDYASQTGYVGSGVAGAYVKNAADVRNDVNYIRRITFNIGRVAAKTPSSLLLAQPLLAGAPPSGASVQRVVAFVDREGGSFFQEWSALFVIPEEAGGRVCFFYPRLQPMASAAEIDYEIAKPLAGVMLHAAFAALPYTDPNDSEQVLCYRSFFPPASAAVY